MSKVQELVEKLILLNTVHFPLLENDLEARVDLYCDMIDAIDAVEPEFDYSSVYGSDAAFDKAVLLVHPECIIFEIELDPDWDEGEEEA